MSDGLLVGCAVVGKTYTIPVLVAHFMTKLKIIEKGKPVGNCESVDKVKDCREESKEIRTSKIILCTVNWKITYNKI